MHFWWAAEQYVERHVDDRCLRVGLCGRRLIGEHQLPFMGRYAHHRKRTAFARAQRLKHGQIRRRYREHVALLALVAPHLFGRQAAFLKRDSAHIKLCPAPSPIDEFWKRIAQAARANVVNGQYGIALTHGGAMVDHLLRTALNLGVAALDGIKIELRVIRACRHRARGATTHADAQPWPAKLDEQGTCGKFAFVRLVCRDAAQAARDHDRLVVPTPPCELAFAQRLLVHTKVAQQIRSAELIVERSTAQWPVKHDLQGTGRVRGLAVGLLLPRFSGIRQVQVRYRKPGQASLRARAASGRALVAYFAPGPCCGASKRRDRCGVVVRLDLHQHMGGLCTLGVMGRVHGIFSKPAHADAAFHDARVIAIGHHHVQRRYGMRVANHLKHRVRLGHAVDRETGVENLVAAMFAIGLRKHHQFDVARVAPQALKRPHEVVDLIVAQCQAQVAVGANQRGTPKAEHVDAFGGRRRPCFKQRAGGFSTTQHAFGHAVVQQRVNQLPLGLAKRLPCKPKSRLDRKTKLRHPLNAAHLQTTVARNIRCL